MNTFLRVLTSLFTSFVFLIGLTACDQIKEFLPKNAASEAVTINAKTPEQALQSVQAAFAAGQFKESLTEAKTYVDVSGPLQAKFAYEAAKSSAKTGNEEDALRFLEQAIAPLGLETTQLMFEPAFESLQQNPAFLALITQQGGQNNPKVNSGLDDKETDPSAEKNSQSKTTTTTTTTVTTTTSSNTTASQAAAPKKKANNSDVHISKSGNEVRAGDVHIKLP